MVADAAKIKYFPHQRQKDVILGKIFLIAPEVQRTAKSAIGATEP